MRDREPDRLTRMPAFRNRLVFEVARGVKAFLALEAGLTRGPVPDPERELGEARRQLRDRERELGRAREKLAEQGGRMAAMEREISGLKKRLASAGEPAGGVEPGRMVWIFGTARVGSSWLMNMMGDLGGNVVWDEPLVGALFGNLFYKRAPHRRGENFVLGDPEEVRSGLIRSFVLSAARAKFPEAAGGGYLIVKEPNGSIGAPLLMAALPESRMVFLIRDPRDVVASSLSGQGEGGWLREQWKKGRREDISPFEDPDEIVRNEAARYRESIEKVRQAYKTHGGPKALVKYEELRSDTLGAMKRLCSELGIEVDEGELSGAVEKHAWENIPGGRKGRGKRNRKATPGSWKEDLTPEQVRIVEEMTEPLIGEFYAG